jgi:hypothetical protein
MIPDLTKLAEYHEDLVICFPTDTLLQLLPLLLPRKLHLIATGWIASPTVVLEVCFIVDSFGGDGLTYGTTQGCIVFVLHSLNSYIYEFMFPLFRITTDAPPPYPPLVALQDSNTNMQL